MEFRLAIDYYEEREMTLGYQFAAEVYAAIERTTHVLRCSRLLKRVFAGALFVGSRMGLFTTTTKAITN